MSHLFTRGLLGLILGALSGVAALAAVYAQHPAITMEMDRTPAVSGLYEAERAGQDTWAWTRRDAALRLPGLDRRVPWSCTIRVRGGRADVTALPQVILSVDGVIAATRQTTNEYQDVSVDVPPRPSAAGAIVALTSSNTVQPGPSDTRALGVMIDRWTCAPGDGARPLPPRQGIVAAAIGGAAFGLALALTGLGLVAIAGGALAIGVGQAIPLAWEFGLFTPYAARVQWLALAIAAVLAGSVRASEWSMGRRLHGAARLVAVVTAVALYLKLLALLHPSKTPVDVVFHAHRLMWVLEGRFFFTQPMPSGVQFPYAIGLYVFAAPWSLLTHDYVLLLRIIVSAAEATGCVLLYLLVSRAWEDRLAGAIAAGLFTVVPRAFEIVGNANMTNAFGQSVALAVVTAAVLWRLGRGDWGQVAGFTALTAFALLCHVSTFTLLGAILLVLAVLYWWRGKPALRAPAVSIVCALAVATVFSIAVYYGHFGDAFRSAARVRASAAAAATSDATPAPPIALAPKVVEAARLSVAAVGWPILALAALGLAPWWRRGFRDRLSLAVAAWLLTFLILTLSVVLAPVGASFLRYAAEFITRVTLATLPAIVVLAGLGCAWALRRGWAWRVPAVAMLVVACYAGTQLWMDWLR